MLFRPLRDFHGGQEEALVQVAAALECEGLVPALSCLGRETNGQDQLDQHWLFLPSLAAYGER